MTSVFANMAGGRWWGSLFFLFMMFAAMSTVLAVFENILACVREMTGWSRGKACLICCVGILLLSVPCALGYNLWSGFHPFGMENLQILDLEDFLVSNCLLPLGSTIFVLFCTRKNGLGWDNFMREANEGHGLKIKSWMRGYITWGLPAIILIIFVMGLISFF